MRIDKIHVPASGTEKAGLSSCKRTSARTDNIYSAVVACPIAFGHTSTTPSGMAGQLAGWQMVGDGSGRISPEDLAAGIYPDGDIRNRPDVRKQIEAARAKPLVLRVSLESFEQRAERIHWEGWTDDLGKRLRRRFYEGAYALSPHTRQLLFDALKAVRTDIKSWRPECDRGARRS